jgi:beta-lactamase class A
VTFQWFADGKAIAGATGRSLNIGASLVDKRLSATVTGAREGVTTKTVSSDQAKPVVRGVTDEALLLSKIKTRLDEHGWKYTVAVRELNGAQRNVSVYGASEREPASTSKLFIAYAALSNIDTGRLTFSRKLPSGTSVRDCLRVLIEVSDNYCARELLAHIGRTKLNARLASEGYSGTEFRSSTNSKGWNKTSTANDLALLLSRLERGQLLSASNTSYLVGLMKQQIWRTRLASGLPSGVNSASKPGELWLSSGMLQLDVGIVYGPKSTYVLTVMGQGNATKAAIKDISKTVFLHLQAYPASTPTVTYPTAQMRTTVKTALRANPGGSSTATIAAGAAVEVVNSQGVWYYVKVNGRTGWINCANLKSRWA